MTEAKHDPAVVPNGAAPPANQPTKTKDVPNKMSLTLSHLPSKKDIKVVYPRSPSTVCANTSISFYICHSCYLSRFDGATACAERIYPLTTRIYASIPSSLNLQKLQMAAY